MDLDDTVQQCEGVPSKLVGRHLASLLAHYEVTAADLGNLHYWELNKIQDKDGKRLPILLVAKLRTAWLEVKAAKRKQVEPRKDAVNHSKSANIRRNEHDDTSVYIDERGRKVYKNFNGR